MRREAITRHYRVAARSAVVVALATLVGCAGSPGNSEERSEVESFRWSELPPVPNEHGFAGAYASMSHGALIVTGGSNFPVAPPWKGGTKSWYGDAYVLEKDAKTWTKVDAALPSARGYGASIGWLDSIICIGGADAARHYADVFKLEWIDGKLIKTDLPPLPIALANIAAARVGTTIYVAGGNETPTATAASTKLFALDLSTLDAKWNELEPLPGAGRILPVAASIGGSFFVVSGASLAADAAGKPARTYLADAYRYTPGRGWSRIADVPHAVVAAPSPAAVVGTQRFAIFGGDDGSMVNFEPKEQHPGFSKDILVYDAAKNVWSTMGTLPLGQVTTTLVDTGDEIIIPNGEIRPATRTPRVMVATPVNNAQ